MNDVIILGVPVKPVSPDEVALACLRWLTKPQQQLVVTTNPEIIMAAQNNPDFFALLQTSYNIPDGSGLQFAAQYLGHRLSHRVTGVDLVEYLLSTLTGGEQSVYLLGAGHGIASSVAQRFSQKNPGLKIVGAESGWRDWQRMPDRTLINRIKRAQPKILLVAFGAPKQELWLAKHLHQFPSVRVAIGVGGSFDFLAGTVRRAPAILRGLRLEWLWRVSIEPWRWPRIMVATWHFSRAVIRYRHNPIHP